MKTSEKVQLFFVFADCIENNSNSNANKDAIFGIKDIISKHPFVLHAHLGPILESCFDLLVDEEANVRQSLKTLMLFILDILDENAVYPFISLLIKHVGASLTHLNTGVRKDAVQFLSIWIDKFPKLLLPFTKDVNKKKNEEKRFDSIQSQKKKKTATSSFFASISKKNVVKCTQNF